MAHAAVLAKNVLVTGGASGIGLAIVRFVAALSARSVIILDISPTTAELVISSLEKEFTSTRFSFKHCDISNWEEQKDAFKEVYSHMGGIDIVFANAGVTEFGKFLENEEGEPSQPNLKTMDINLVGTLYTVYYMRKSATRHKGSIICTGSNAGIYPFPVAPIYGISKHAVVGAIRSLAPPLEAEGIQINGICPNVIRTGLAGDHLLSEMQITPMSTALEAVGEFLAKPELTGRIAEVSGDKFTLREAPEYVDEMTRKNLDTFTALGYA
ncbi:hypothetical protein G7Y89_g3784 [Cudoniella acicularis]|uniref:Uncharacterized protein n=1 Tax=Cudoniella acicularis TaxID=354080 RepID=A0A8H4W7B4_9HELO|nr:hypothetical protein G7Y89_g3784 [Cudoniella acicularis]